MSLTEIQRQSTYFVVVNKGFHWEKHRLYLRYNESWFATEPPTGVPDYGRNTFEIHPRIYQPHIWDPAAVALDWESASSVPALGVTVPDHVNYEIVRARRTVVEPVEMDFSNAAVVGIPSDPRTAFSTVLNSTFYVATYDRVTRYRWVVSGEGRVTLAEERLCEREED